MKRIEKKHLMDKDHGLSKEFLEQIKSQVTDHLENVVNNIAKKRNQSLEQQGGISHVVRTTNSALTRSFMQIKQEQINVVFKPHSHHHLHHDNPETSHHCRASSHALRAQLISNFELQAQQKLVNADYSKYNCEGGVRSLYYLSKLA